MNSKGAPPVGSVAEATTESGVGAKKGTGASLERKEFVLNMMGEFNKKVD